MPNVRFAFDGRGTYAGRGGYLCDTPGDQSGEYVPAAEVARLRAERDALWHALAWAVERMDEAADAGKVERKCYCNEIEEPGRGLCDYCLDQQALAEARPLLDGRPSPGLVRVTAQRGAAVEGAKS